MDNYVLNEVIDSFFHYFPNALGLGFVSGAVLSLISYGVYRAFNLIKDISN